MWNMFHLILKTGTCVVVVVVVVVVYQAMIRQRNASSVTRQPHLYPDAMIDSKEHTVGHPCGSFHQFIFASSY